MIDFVSLTTPRHVDGHRFAIDVPDGWQQGRGAFGGFSLACLVRAIESTENGPERPLRVLTAELCGPLLPGPADIVVEPLRRGAGMTTVAARIVQEGSVLAHAVGMLARAREDRPYDGMAAPHFRPFEDVPVTEPSATFGPAFAQFFEYRVAGPLALSGHSVAEVETWVRLRLPVPRFDAAVMTALADATWPALFSVMKEPRPMGTISFTLNLFGPFDDLRAGAPVYHRARVLWARDGHSAELRELWSEDGRLLSLNQQTFATIR